MKVYEFDAVTYDGDVYCNNCLPDGVEIEDDDVAPIFAGDEWQEYPVCCVCGEVHKYMSLIQTRVGAPPPPSPDDVIRVGDIVMYSRKWLQSAGFVTGPVPFAEGIVRSVHTVVEGMTFAYVEWDRIPTLEVNVANLVKKDRRHLEPA
jgi:hypothetical protein